MIMTVEEARKHVEGISEWTDEKLERKLKAVEQAIRSHTNNNFQDRAFRITADIVSGVIPVSSPVPFKAGDTIQISETLYNKGLFTVKEITEDSKIVLVEGITDENAVLITKIVYPADVVDCCINLLEWEANNRSKAGIKSETLSRHSVTYIDLDKNNQVMGYPVSLMGGLTPYMKARC